MNQEDFSWEEVGRRIKDRRLAQGLNQKQLALSAKLTPAGLLRVEAGDTNPSIDTLRRIAAALRISVRELIQGRLPDHGIRHEEVFNRVERILVSGDAQAIRILATGIYSAELRLDRKILGIEPPDVMKGFKWKARPKIQKKK